MALQLGEFWDDPQSILDPSFLGYDSSNEDDSDGSTDEHDNSPDCTLDIITHHPQENTWFLNQPTLSHRAQYKPTVRTIPMKHDTVENDTFIWSVPLDNLCIPVQRPRFTLVLKDYRERFRVKVRQQDLNKELVIGHYLVQLITAPNAPLRITDVLLRGPLHHPPLMISVGRHDRPLPSGSREKRGLADPCRIVCTR